MPLDGLRAWIGEVERKLRMRTRVFLVLATIAIGGAGAAIYLAIDTRDNAVSESDVQELQEQLETRIDESAAQEAPSQSNPSESDRSGAAGGAKATPEGSKAKLPELVEQAEEAKRRAEEEQQGK